MAPIAIVFGLLLTAVGLVGYLAPEVFGSGEARKSMTGLIPAFLGGILVLCGLVVSMKPTLRKHVMHVAALVGLFGAVGGTMPIIRAGGLDTSKSSVIAGILTTVLSIVFVALCVRSFIQARKARQAAANHIG
jgi:hypothetical protein